MIDHTNQLDEKTATNNRSIHDVDDRATAGIKQAQGLPIAPPECTERHEGRGRC